MNATIVTWSLRSRTWRLSFVKWVRWSRRDSWDCYLIFIKDNNFLLIDLEDTKWLTNFLVNSFRFLTLFGGRDQNEVTREGSTHDSIWSLIQMKSWCEVMHMILRVTFVIIVGDSQKLEVDRQGSLLILGMKREAQLLLAGLRTSLCGG